MNQYLTHQNKQLYNEIVDIVSLVGKTMKDFSGVFNSLSSLCLSSMIKALTVFLVYYELKNANINDSINLSIN